MLVFYNIVLILSFVILSPFIFYKLVTDRRYRQGLSERLGYIDPRTVSSVQGRGPVWFHAASVGEVLASLRLLEGIRERWPEKGVLVSTFTPTGNEIAKAKLQSKVGSRQAEGKDIADAVIFLPLDLPWVVERVLRKVNPSILILMETELWPNLVNRAGRLGIPVFLVNGRISDRSYGKYWAVSFIFKKVLASIKGFFMQTEGDAGRIVALGADPSTVVVTGNIKFDETASDEGIGFMERWSGPVLIAGSTHRGEDEVILDIYRGAKADFPGLKLIIAPRHVERVGEVKELLAGKGLHYDLRSQVIDNIDSQILLIDTLGELSLFYRYGDVIFIGGSLVPVGGHNVLEPALSGRPVLFGPHMGNFRDASRILIGSGGGIMIKDPAELKGWVSRLLSDQALRDSIGEKAREGVLKNQGATMRTLDGLAELC